MNNYKNCGHIKKNHGCKGYSDAKDDIGKGACNYCNCKQFIPNHSSLECNDNNIEKGKSQLSSYSEDKDPSDEPLPSEEVSRIDEGSDIPLRDKAECIGCDDYEELIYYHNDVKECMI